MKTIKYTLLLLLITQLFSFNISAQTVRVSGRKILLNGGEYKIHGVCYSRGGAGNYTQDIALMKEANINTIRTYSPINDRAELDAFANAGIRIIMHLNENNFESYVNTYKNHPAILLWEFGNEFNYHPEWFGGNLWNWYGQLEANAQRVHQLDPNHPVSTAHGEVPPNDVLNACPSVDVWGMNLYRWDNDVPALTDLNSRLAGNKALFVAEAGGDSYNKAQNAINEGEQATANRNILTGITNRYDICAGVTLFEFCDEWWKAGNDGVQNPGGSAPNSSGVPYDGSADEEYWGIVRRDRSKKATFNVVRDIYGAIGDNNGTNGVSGLAGTYSLINRRSGLAMDVAENGNPANGTNILQWNRTGNPNQQFRLTEVSSGVYSIICVKTNKSLDIDAVSNANFANLHQWDYVGGANQHFKIENAGNGFYKLRATHSNKIIEVAYASLDAGANINQYDDNGQLCGQWQLVPVGGSSWSTTLEAENYALMSGVQTESCSEGGSNVGYIDANDWMVWDVNVPSNGTYLVEYRVASQNGGGNLQLEKAGGNPVYGTRSIPATGGWQNWSTVSHTVNLSAGQQQMAIKALAGGWNLNWIKLTRQSGAAARKATSELEVSKQVLYPNPTTNYIKLSIPKTMKGAEYKIVDKAGRKVLSGEYSGDSIDVSTLPSNLYILQIEKDKTQITEKFIKE
ncbi:carbohydrate-binding protein [Fulvivirga ligni]|uniref:carbohydrate-binding protein n=1 Tax=Fulvivirga ligni TaxID=2904246 RepID=UPI001F28FE0D|nr:carbohydrate-binding protein [Fulvivirga ligni]UII19967.1 carbohydrate-binding protein [Fulvivirga ligni]